MGVTNGGQKTPLNTVMQHGMEVPISGALDIRRSLYLTIDHLLEANVGT